MAPNAAVRFLDALATDTALQQEVNVAVAGGAERFGAVAAVAGRHGHTFTAHELKAAVEARTPSGGEEITDAELEGVAGGMWEVKKISGRERRA
jgi:predicted ribosomally synthesized peptide with nif11-like leader